MEVAVTSIVRNAMGYIDRYVSQVNDLAMALYLEGEHNVTVCMAEGDSVDGTWDWLQNWAVGQYETDDYEVRLVKADHGGPAFGSVDNAVRWQNIARTWNKLYQYIAFSDYRPDAVIYVEADLIWRPETMQRLLRHLAVVPAVAPMSMLRPPFGWFYDTWGHRAIDGSHFQNAPPFHAILNDWRPGTLLQIWSAGSCMVMRGEIIGKCWFSETDAMIGHDLYAEGYSLWLDPSLSVEHP